MRLIRHVALPALLLCGCWFSRDEHVQACSSDRDCGSGYYCYVDLCLPINATATAGVSAAGCAQGSSIESCYGGPAGTQGVGICQAGQRVCASGTYTDCLGQVLPQSEVCNGKDDDCNGEVDDIGVTSGCDTHLQGACGEGSLVCHDGVGFCQPVRQSETESCNGVDDDCDGSVDEVVAAPCYPDGLAGCTLDAEGNWQCQGRCAPGILDCSGAAQSCKGSIHPVEELCTRGDDFAQDEDCDGEIDEACPCNDGDTRPCYAGPAGTNGHGTCRAGTQTCASAVWGFCDGQVIPRAETCANPNADDDCNGVIDDIPGIDAPCVALGARGLCRGGTLSCVLGLYFPHCVPGSPLPELCDDIDQDCDGDPTNGFDLNSDATCGACDVRCSAATEECCGGTCIDRSSLEDDIQNCGACGNTCGEGQYCCQGDCLTKATPMMMACDCAISCGSLSCCGAMCRDLQTDKDNCGACGLKCGPGKTCVAGVCEAAK